MIDGFIKKHLERIKIKQIILKKFMEEKSWENLAPAPLDFFHHRMWELWHQERARRHGSSQGAPTEMTVSFRDIGDMIVRAKMDTYAEYPNSVSDKAVPKGKK